MDRSIGLVVTVFVERPGDQGSIPRRVIPKTQKWYLISPCLTLSIIRYISRVKWSNPRKGVAPFPTLRCGSYWKENLRVTLDYGWLYIFIYIYIPLVLWVFANGPGDRDSIAGRAIPEKEKMVHDAVLLNTQPYTVRIKSKVEQSPTPWWSSYLKESLPVTLNYDFQLYFTIDINECINKKWIKSALKWE